MAESREVYQVVPEGNGWTVRHAKEGFLGRTFWKSEAVELGTTHAMAAGLSRLLILRKDGSVEADHLYGAA